METLDTPIRAIALHFGVGAERISQVCFLKAPRSFNTPLAAVRHLAHEMLGDFKEHHMQEDGFHESLCCAQNRERNPSANFCQECGKKLYLPKFCGLTFQRYVADVLTEGPIHNYGGNWYSPTSTCEMLRSNADSILVFNSGAERFLFLALQDDTVPGLTEDQNEFWETQQDFDGFEDFEERLWGLGVDWGRIV